MVVASCRITLYLSDAQSLKDKRRVVKGLLERLKARHNVSAVEADGHELWQKAVLAVALAARDRDDAAVRLERVRREVEEGSDLKHVEFEEAFL